MSSYLLLIMLSLMIPLILLLFSSLFMENDNISELGESPFECGFEPFTCSRIPFSMQIFSITIVFLIFDLEVVILLPLMVSTESSSWSCLMLSSMMFVLMIGLLIEWYDCSLNWTL